MVLRCVSKKSKCERYYKQFSVLKTVLLLSFYYFFTVSFSFHFFQNPIAQSVSDVSIAEMNISVMLLVIAVVFSPLIFSTKQRETNPVFKLHHVKINPENNNASEVWKMKSPISGIIVYLPYTQNHQSFP